MINPRKLSAALLAMALLQWGQAGWIHAKAVLAQHLIDMAWQQTLVDPDHYREHLPWRWADTFPVARLQWLREEASFQVLEIKADYLVLAGGHGSALAFGPGNIDGTALPGLGGSVVGGHRDTHFRFLRDIAVGDRLRVQNLFGEWKTYRVSDITIADSTRDQLLYQPQQDAIWLVTCYPFDALQPGGPLRYVVRAEHQIDNTLVAF